MQTKTYLECCLSRTGHLQKWPQGLMPLCVYIAPFRWYKSMGEADSYKYRGMIINALNTWQSALSGMVTFSIVNNLNDSHINVEWKRVDRKSLGQCQFNYDNYGRFYSAEVSIGLSDGIIHRQYMDENEVYHTILHEFGHAIGLGHSPYAEDIMYTPHQYGRVSLSNSDIQTARFLYKFDTGKTAKEVLNQYSYLQPRNLDHLVSLLLNEKTDFQKTMDSFKTKSNKDLIQENANIGELKKYLMQINSIKFNFNDKGKN